jgi:TonB family protein
VTAEHRVAEADSAYASSHGAVSGFSSAGGSAAAPAPAKDEKAVEKEISPLPALALDQDKDKDQKDKHSENRITEAKPALVSRPSSAPASVTPITLATSINTDPVFGGITEEDSSRSARTNRILVVAAVVVALAVLGYFSTDGKFGIRDKTAAPQPVNEQLQTQPQTQSVPAPAPATTSAPSDSSTNQPDTASSPGQVSTIQPATGQTPAVPTPTQPPVPTTLTQRLSASVMNSPLVRMGENLVSGTRRTAAALIVKTSRVSAPKPAQVEDPAPPPPQTAIVASANSNASNLNGLMSTAASNIAKPSLVPLNVSQGVTQGLLIKRVTPKYPQAALASHTQGSVQIEATVNKEGDVVNPKILSGDPLLAHAAVEAVRQWRYKPYYLNGNPVEIKTQITVNFKAD